MGIFPDPGLNLVALALFSLRRLVPPAVESIAAFPTTVVNYFRVRIDPAKSGKTDRVIRCACTEGRFAGLQVRRAVAESIADSDAY
jgi:hypothetical protein